ncbi:MAG: membrane-associated phospholipid phosphatase [Flavobacteriales bacterium]|jgi:membrane-associated phospholipid phosphatase
MLVFTRFISYWLHPLFMPLYCLVLCFQFDPYLNTFLPHQAKLTLYGIIVVNTIIIPLATLVFLKKKKLISSYQLETRQERALPYGMVLIYYSLTYLVLRKTGLPQVVFSLMLTGIAGIALVWVVNFYWKISAHATGIGGLVGAFLGLSILHQSQEYEIMFVLFLLAGLVGSARLFLKAHSPAQVYAGFLLSFFISYLIVSNAWIL